MLTIALLAAIAIVPCVAQDNHSGAAEATTAGDHKGDVGNADAQSSRAENASGDTEKDSRAAASKSQHRHGCHRCPDSAAAFSQRLRSRGACAADQRAFAAQRVDAADPGYRRADACNPQHDRRYRSPQRHRHHYSWRCHAAEVPASGKCERQAGNDEQWRAQRDRTGPSCFGAGYHRGTGPGGRRNQRQFIPPQAHGPALRRFGAALYKCADDGSAHTCDLFVFGTGFRTAT